MSKSEEFGDWVKARDRDVESRQFKKPLTDNHRRYVRMVEEKAITLAVGPAGTGKTTLAVAVAARLFKEGKAKQIVITRPTVECGGKLGTLPGGPDEKMALFVAPVVQALGRHFAAAELQAHRLAERIVVVPLEQMRGLTFDKAFVICDEAQNASYEQLHMLMTRLGFDSRLVVNGDVRQSDLGGPDVPLVRAISRLGAAPRRPDIGFMAMTKADVLRPDIVSFVDERLGG